MLSIVMTIHGVSVQNGNMYNVLYSVLVCMYVLLIVLVIDVDSLMFCSEK